MPIVIGLWTKGKHPVLAAFDATRRIGNLTRQSLFAPLWQLQLASQDGWAEHVSDSDERIYVFRPELLPAYVDMVGHGVTLHGDDVRNVLDASGINDEAVPSKRTVERARRTTTALVRSAIFSRKLAEAYGGYCAMCGLDFGLVEGAHIYPVAAPGSSDDISNGLALCANHHRAFDRHLVHVDPGTASVRISPSLTAAPRPTQACEQFISGTLGTLMLPAVMELRPSSEMFQRRYDFFDPQYEWAR